MISHEFKCIFIHIPKTAGSSIEVFFEEYPRTQHVLATECLKEYGGKDWNRYYKFAFVRNPWDRVLSWYLWLERDAILYDWQHNIGAGGWNLKSDWGINGGHPRVVPSWYTGMKDGFKDFIFSIKSTKDKKDYNLKIKGNGGKGKWIASQLTWLKNSRGKIPLNYVGRFEHLERDFKRVCKKLKIIQDPLPKAKVMQNRPHYSQFYDKETTKQVRKLYADDIQYFGYKFEKKDEIKHKL